MKKKDVLLKLTLIPAICILLLSCSDKSETSEDENSITINDPLPSWREGNNKLDIIDFVNAVTDETSPSFVPIAERIATFDNDGCLWSEQPMYFQLFFIFDKVKDMAVNHPEWDSIPPFSYVLANDTKGLAQMGEHGLMTLLMASHADMTSVEFEAEVKKWALKAQHPEKKMAFTEMVYQPMLELLEYLRANDFKTYIVSGGGVDFMRALVQDVYGIPAEQIIGSTIKTEFEPNNGEPFIHRMPDIFFIDDKEGKPENIQRIIGRKPILSAGNSDGDLAMLQWTASSPHRFLNIYIHHTDSVREWAYDRASHIGKLDKGLDVAIKRKWTVVSMKDDWETIYPVTSK